MRRQSVAEAQLNQTARHVSITEQPWQARQTDKRKRMKKLPDGYGWPEMPSFTYRIIPDFVGWLFGCYGYMIGKFPWLFLLLGLATGFAAIAGLYRIKLDDDPGALVNQFVEMGSRYFTDDAIVAEWKNSTQNLNSLSTSAYSNAPPGDERDANPVQSNVYRRRRKRDEETGVEYEAEEEVEEEPIDRVCDWWTYVRKWRIQGVIIVSKNESLLNVESLREAFHLVWTLRTLLKCDMDDDGMLQTDRLFCCDSWDLQRMKYEIFGTEEDDRSPEEVMTQFFSIITYPADKRFRINNQERETIFTNSLGGVKRNDANNGYNARVTAVKAMQFNYFLPATWTTLEAEKLLTETLWKTRNQYKTFDVYWETHQQTQNEFNRQIIFEEMPKVAITFICVIVWCLIGALNSDALNSKPWFGVLGIVSTGMAVAAGFGAQFWVGDTFQTYLIAVPLMALAIGLDDMFILMNAWLNTDPCLPREERSKRMMQEGGTSIFVTVMMTIIDFVVGTNVPYPAIQKYSDFALWSLAFDFILQMTIFVSCLVMSDSWEKSKKQACCFCLTIKQRTPKSVLESEEMHVICCSYGRIDDVEKQMAEKAQKLRKKQLRKERRAAPLRWRPERIYENLDEWTRPPPAILHSDEDDKDNADNRTFGEHSEDDNEFSSGKRIIYVHVAPFLLHPITRGVIFLSAVILITASVVIVWTTLEVGFHPAHLANRKSNTYNYKMVDWEYFRDFTDSLRLETLIEFETAPLKNNFTLAKHKVMRLVDKIEEFDSYIWGPRLNRVAFRDVPMALSMNETHSEWNWTIAEGVDFYANLTESTSMKPALLDMGTKTEKLRIMATFQIRNVSRLERGAELAQRLKELQAGYEREPGFRLYITDTIKVLRVFDQIVNLPSQFIYFAFITVASTVITSFVMIPNPICMFWMALSSMTIILGTLAGMSLWGVGLDPVSLIYLLMAIGATADYICHCIYTFTVADPEIKVEPGEKPDWAKMRYAKARHLLGELVAETGPAVIGTTLSIVVLSTSFNYVLESFFKVFFVAVVSGIYFSVIVLPAILCQFGPVAKQCCEPEIFQPKFTQTEDEETYYYEEIKPAKPKPIMPLLVVETVPETPKPTLEAVAPKREQPDVLDKISVAANGQVNPELEGDYYDIAKLQLLRRYLNQSREWVASQCNLLDYELPPQIGGRAIASSLMVLNASATELQNDGQDNNVLVLGNRKIKAPKGRQHLTGSLMVLNSQPNDYETNLRSSRRSVGRASRRSQSSHRPKQDEVQRSASPSSVFKSNRAPSNTTGTTTTYNVQRSASPSSLLTRKSILRRRNSEMSKCHRKSRSLSVIANFNSDSANNLSKIRRPHVLNN